jgi:hypothetical protein
MSGAVVLLIGGAWAFVLPSVLERWVRGEPGTGMAYAADEKRADGLAPVILVSEGPPWAKGEPRMQNCVRFVLSRGQIFVGDETIQEENIRAYLDERVLREEIRSVVIFPAVGSKWGEIFPVLDACRKSRVQAVYLNEYEDPKPPV